MNLHDLPPTISGLVKLKELYMGNTKVEKLPKDVGQLKSLKMLHLNGCEHLKTVPENFGCLEQFEDLDMFENPCVEVLLERFGDVKAFDYLDIGGCSVGEGIRLVSNFGDIAKLKSLFLDGNLMSTFPESFKDLNGLVTLQMSQCPNLVVIQALPSNLERLNIGNCPKLTNIPYLGNLNTLKYLILNNCPKLTDLQGLDFVQMLVEVNISNSKMLSIAFGLNHDRALQMCGLSGSQSSMIYDSNWWKKEPTLQVVSYYDNVFPQPFPNSIRQTFVFKQQSEDKLCLNATILNEKECVAIIFCFCAHELEQ
jgi:Leucine-rich repeat (LRR) protein